MRKLNYTDKESDNVDTKGLQPIIKEWLESLDMPWSDGNLQIDELEYISRSGFIAHNHNRGGMDLINITSSTYLFGSGEHNGLAIENIINKTIEDNYEYAKKDNPNATDEQISDIVWEQSNEYDDVAYRIRVMYEGDNTLVVHVGYDTDAPYFRWNDTTLQEIEIKFKNKADLKRQLKKIKVVT